MKRRSLIRVQKKGQVTLPTALREQVGVADGDLLEVRVQRGSFVLRPRVAIDRSRFSTAAGQYTPEQRKIVDAELAAGLADIKAGRVSRAFETAEEFIADLHKASAERPGTRKKAKRRGR